MAFPVLEHVNRCQGRRNAHNGMLSLRGICHTSMSKNGEAANSIRSVHRVSKFAEIVGSNKRTWRTANRDTEPRGGVTL
ncbi:hypothetical protein FIBSPDRAFT_848457 [Athelia psychrophila]|uniref:Uncharacterized protein n=1 Tax=Athelia psychrophila TaxID=1759441 RepID=A0A166VET6_9AGAM|nr:hypothetical protein FIBSPDRAFT_861499 [Fibularhizoctonia sp. CBS 109695]KZP32653.1 hypothetical protein FIBSPDRAFT_848457 [Fibularhizoctonia sp. CBS 109695]